MWITSIESTSASAKHLFQFISTTSRSDGVRVTVLTCNYFMIRIHTDVDPTGTNFLGTPLGNAVRMRMTENKKVILC